MSKSNTTKAAKSMESENENENDNENENSRNRFSLPSSFNSSSLRSPLNTIPDPCQSSGGVPTPARVSGLYKGKANSAAVQSSSTPARSGGVTGNTSRVSNVHRPLHLNAARGGGSGGNVSRGISSVVSSEASVVPHFELVQDPCFWEDHNVQVLIRIRPLSNMEKVSQGYGTCLKQESAQTLVWLGHPETRFTFDHVACQTISQEKLFSVAGLPMVDNCMSGYNSCMFAYGQTGSGKTYTMMGEIGQVDGKLDEHCGITPRIFEYLFTRIKEEEENRRSEGLQYSCKCSFLEIYNEQITDLLESSSTNLQLREDLQKGVYVENLSEYDVRSANDIISLLREGAANRKMAATHMNSESSRSHSVFTCIIESRWEKDSMNHLRYARLNLVDLAGSERQKSSAADGDRLKEAANINKSLSTLGLVIMSLVDLAHGKQRHVPYRDSRLTFLLQDSLGGNSKTTIIANVSPSTCSANETWSTLKFAQRAKLIQNNAKVNEDASGDVTLLQRQIQLLKGQLNFLMKHQDPSKRHSNCLASMEESCKGDFLERCDSFEEVTTCDNDDRDGKVKRLKTTLVGALRREKVAEMEVQRLKTELEQMKCLVYQREEDAERTKLMLKVQEERIKQMELCGDGLLSADKYLVDENNALREEIQVLQARKIEHLDVTKFESENFSQLQQLKKVQNSFEQGERETLLAELSELRDQHLEILEAEGSCWHPQYLLGNDKQSNVGQEFKECKDMNSRLISEADELQRVLDKHMKCYQDEVDSVQAVSIEGDQLDDLTCYKQLKDQNFLSKNDQIMDSMCVLQYKDIEKQLVDARLLVETMESKQVHLVAELESMREEKNRLTGILNTKETERQPAINQENCYEEKSSSQSLHLAPEIMASKDVVKVALQVKLDKLSEDLQAALSLNNQYLEDHASRLSQDHQIELVRDEVEVETATTILHLQEELVALQSEFEERLCSMEEENAGLRMSLAAKDDEITTMSTEWEKATLELTSFLLDGSKSLRDASRQIEGIASSFPHVNVRIGEHVERAAKICTQKEKTILSLQCSLEDAQKTVLLMDHKLNSLKGATIALTDADQLDYDDHNEVRRLVTAFNSDSLQKTVKCNEDHTAEAEKCAVVACSAVKMIFDHPVSAYKNNTEKDMPFVDVYGLVPAEADIVGELERQAQLETEDALNSFCSDAEAYLSALKSDIQEAVSIYKEILNDLVNDVREARRNCSDLKLNGRSLAFQTFGVPFDSHKFVNHENQQQLLHQMKDELVKTNDRLNTVNACFYEMVEHCGYKFPKRITNLDLEIEERSIDTSHSQESEKFDGHVKNFNHELLVCLRKEFKSTYRIFSKLNAQLDGFFTEKDGDCYAAGLSFPEPHNVMVDNDQGSVQDGCDQPIVPEFHQSVQYPDLITQKADASGNNTRKLDAGHNFGQATSFFTKIEEAHATMEEADHMLKALLKANENANHLSLMWKQAGEDLQFEKANLIQEIQQLKSSITIREGENGILRDHIYFSLTEIANSVALLEGAFDYMQKDVEEFCKVAYCEALNLVKESLNWICSSKVMLEEIFSKAMENEFTSLFLECHMKDFIHKFNTNYAFSPITFQCEPLETKNHSMDKFTKWAQCIDETSIVRGLEGGGLSQVHDDPEKENLALKGELERKEVLLKGLLFDFRLLQESASGRQDFKYDFEKLIANLNQVQYELQLKSTELDDLQLQHRALEDRLSITENALTIAKSDLEEATETSNSLSEQNADLRVLVKDLYLKKSEAEDQLEEQKEVVKSLEEEILRMASSTENQLASSVKEDDLNRVIEERDKLLEQLQALQVRLDTAFALADENETIAVEARQESEASKMYAEQKEEEVKILERSVEELECTINVLEKKVYGMEDEVQRQHLIRDSLELEIQALMERLSTVTESFDSEDSNMEQSKAQILRCLEVHEVQSQIRVLEEEKAELVKEIQQYKEYISELVLHAEAQSSQYQEKYKYLEAMVREANTDLPTVTYGVPTVDKTEKSSSRTRGSGSPFRCITNLVQQMNLEKDQELSMTKARIEELEALAASRQKEVCILNSRLAAAESMTHDVIRDLLGVKLDMTNYANLAEQYQLQELVEEAQQQKQESITMEKEILNLRRQLTDLTEEREQCILEVNRREADVLAAQMTLEQLKERDQLLTAQNEMLKMDKTNLQRRIAELDDMMKKLFGIKDIQSRNYQRVDSRRGSSSDFSQIQSRNQQRVDLRRGSNSDLSQKPCDSGKQLLRVDDELARYRRLDCTNPHRKQNDREN